MRYFFIYLFSLLFSSQGVGQTNDSIKNYYYNLYDDIKQIDSSIFYRVKQNGKYGIIDNKSKEIVPPIYEFIYDNNPPSSSYQAGYIYLLKGDSTYLFSTKYEKLLPFACDFYCRTMEQGVFIIGKKDRIGIYKKGKGLVIPFNYLDAVYKNGFFFLKNENGDIEIYNLNNEKTKLDWKVVEVNHALFLSNQYYSSDPKILFLALKNGKYGVLNSTLEKVIDFNYERDDIFFKNDFVYLKEDEKWYCAELEDGFNKRLVHNLSST